MPRPYRSWSDRSNRDNLLLVVYTWNDIHRERRKNDHMNDECDFSDADHGRFYRKDATLVPPRILLPTRSLSFPGPLRRAASH